jgi:predicted MFS family arabinose efflux permease
MKRIFSITFLNFFISGGLTLAIPLLLLDRHVDLVEIGLIISIYPLVFLVARLLIAVFADLRAWANRVYLLLNWPANLLATFMYLVASSPFMFVVGKVFEAVKESSYWAVNRTTIFSLSPKREEKEATRNYAVLLFATAVGSAAAGLGIAYLGFSLTFGVFIVAAGIIGFPAALLWKHHKQDPVVLFEKRRPINLRNYGRRFWLVSIAMVFFTLSSYPLLNLLLPVFMQQQLGYSYVTIGIAYTLFNVVASIIIFASLKFSIGIKRVIFQSSIALFASFLLAYLNVAFLGLFLALAVAQGLGQGVFESIVAKTTKNKPSVSADIGLLHVPVRFAEFTSLLYAGFVAQNIGYAPVFFSCGISFVSFSFLALYLLKN